MPNAKIIRDNSYRQFSSGDAPLTDYLASQREFNDGILHFVNARARLWRSALALNTAIGKRITP
jgi:outer membrane protein TolC